MPLNTKVGGVWKSVISAHTKVSGVWKTVTAAWLKVGVAWKLAYVSLTQAAYSSSNLILFPGGSAVTTSVTAALNLSGSYTYHWYYTGTPSTTTSVTGATFTLRLIDNNDVSASGTVWCAITDGDGDTVLSQVSTWSLTLFS